MLPRSRRLTIAEFPRQKAVRTHSSDLLRVKEYPGKNRAAVVVSKKVDVRAAARNILKRRIMAALAKKDFKGKDIVVVVERSAAAAPRAALMRDLAILLGKI
jgi:ribonuclease P protein component